MGVPCQSSGWAGCNSANCGPAPAQYIEAKTPCSAAARGYGPFRLGCFFHVCLGVASRPLWCRLKMLLAWGSGIFGPLVPFWTLVATTLKIDTLHFCAPHTTQPANSPHAPRFVNGRICVLQQWMLQGHQLQA